jgi:hypothetical protein
MQAINTFHIVYCVNLGVDDDASIYYACMHGATDVVHHMFAVRHTSTPPAVHTDTDIGSKLGRVLLSGKSAQERSSHHVVAPDGK